MPQLSERTRKICMEDINKEIAKRTPPAPEQPTDGGGKGKDDEIKDPPPAPPKLTRTLYKSNLIPYQLTVKSDDDIEKILSDLRRKLEKELEDNGEFKLV